MTPMRSRTREGTLRMAHGARRQDAGARGTPSRRFQVAAGACDRADLRRGQASVGSFSRISVRRRHGISSWSVRGSRGTVPRIGTPRDAARGEVRWEQVLRGVGMSGVPAESGNGHVRHQDTASATSWVLKLGIDLAFFGVPRSQ